MVSGRCKMLPESIIWGSEVVRMVKNSSWFFSSSYFQRTLPWSKKAKLELETYIILQKIFFMHEKKGCPLGFQINGNYNRATL